jgi:hypothetical protein
LFDYARRARSRSEHDLPTNEDTRGHLTGGVSRKGILVVVMTVAMVIVILAYFFDNRRFGGEDHPPRPTRR